MFKGVLLSQFFLNTHFTYFSMTFDLTIISAPTFKFENLDPPGWTLKKLLSLCLEISLLQATEEQFRGLILFGTVKGPMEDWKQEITSPGQTLYAKGVICSL